MLAVDNVEHELSGLLPLVEEDGWKWIVAQNAFYQLPSVSFGPDRFALEARGELKMALIVIIARAWDIPPSIQNILKEGFEDSDPSALKFYVMVPPGFAGLLARNLFAGRFINPKEIPDVPWLRFNGAMSFRNVTILEKDTPLSIGDAFRSVIVQRLFKLRPEELAQLQAAHSTFNLSSTAHEIRFVKERASWIKKLTAVKRFRFQSINYSSFSIQQTPLRNTADDRGLSFEDLG